MSNFSFSTVLSKETYLQTRKNQGLFGKGLITLALYQMITSLKAFEEVKFNVVRTRISLFDTVKSIVGKGENHGYQHLFLFLQCFPKLFSFFLSLVKSLEFVVKSLPFITQFQVLTIPRQKKFENTVGKQVNYGKQHLLLFFPSNLSFYPIT